MHTHLHTHTHTHTCCRQDAYAAASYERARDAVANHRFDDEICAVQVKDRKGKVTVVSTDDEPQRYKAAAIPKLRAAFTKGGTVTAGNSSVISDGAAACVLMSGRRVKELGVGAAVLARVVSYAGKFNNSRLCQSLELASVK
jgi:acetyl-CoA C-acetyltransferase